MITFHVAVKYIGGDDGLGYTHGSNYVLQISQHLLSHKITAVPVHGYEYRTIEDMRCQFDSLYYFLECFQILGNANGPNNWRRDREDYYATGQ